MQVYATLWQQLSATSCSVKGGDDMKKVISLLFVSLICITLILPSFAAEFENPPIVDTAEILSESQLEELTEKADASRSSGPDVTSS